MLSVTCLVIRLKGSYTSRTMSVCVFHVFVQLFTVLCFIVHNFKLTETWKYNLVAAIILFPTMSQSCVLNFSIFQVLQPTRLRLSTVLRLQHIASSDTQDSYNQTPLLFSSCMGRYLLGCYSASELLHKLRHDQPHRLTPPMTLLRIGWQWISWSYWRIKRKTK